MDWMNLLGQLTAASSVSGSEENIADTVLSLLSPNCDSAEQRQGNVLGTLGERQPGKPHVLLDAHMDQVGFLVTAITEEGFLRVGNAGGLDFRLMPAQRVTVHGKQDIPGVICCVPPHLQGGEEHVLSVTELAIDTGYTKAELEQIVTQGDTVSFAMPLLPMENDRVCGRSLDDRSGIAAIVCGRSLDDRSGIAAILYALSLVQGEELPCSCSVLFSTQEETGERGATIGAFTIEPDIALAVDVTFALGHGDDPVKCGKMGGGPMIGISPTLSRDVTNALIAAADAEQIPWQPEVMSGMTGTNADRFSVTKGGVRTGTVSIPLRYMHTPAEVIQISDVKQTGELLAAYLRRCSVC